MHAGGGGILYLPFALALGKEELVTRSNLGTSLVVQLRCIKKLESKTKIITIDGLWVFFFLNFLLKHFFFFNFSNFL